MSIEFRCNQCGKLLRTGDETVGRQAQCPACGAISVVPATNSSAPLHNLSEGGETATGSPFRVDPTVARNSDNPYQSPFAATYSSPFGLPDPMAAQRVSGPATALLILGILGAVGQVLGVLGNVAQLPLANEFGRANVGAPPMVLAFIPSIILGFFGLVMSGLVIVGSLRMKKLENYSLAMTAAVIAVIPCVSSCCIFSLPFGIWAIIVLNDSSVKAAFRS
jgi:hypothetical protein